MKKKLISAVIATFMLALYGCTGPSQTTQNPAPAQAKELHIYVMRHGRTMLNTTDRVQGWSDAVLTPEGEEVVSYAAAGLQDVDFQAAYSSDSGRAMQTAQLVIAGNNKNKELQLHPDKRFREFNFGSYEGDLNHTMWKDVAKRMGIPFEDYLKVITPEAVSNHVHELDKERMKNSELSNWPAENFKQIQDRLVAGLDSVVAAEASRSGSGNVLIASHGLSIEAMMTTLFGKDYGKPEGGFKNASVSVIKYADGNYTLEKAGSLEYIEAGQKMKKNG